MVSLPQLTHHEARRARRARKSHSSSRPRQTLEGEVQYSGKPTSVLVTYPNSYTTHPSWGACLSRFSL